jgi:hypothetical protein
MKRSLRALLYGLIVLTFVAGAGEPVLAAGMQKVVVRPRPRSVPMQAMASGGLSISVVNLNANAGLNGARAGTAVLDLGSVSYAGFHTADVTVERRKNSFIVTTVFGLLVQDPSHHTQYATVSAFVTGANPEVVYSIDDRKLSSTPTVIVPRSAIGEVSKHTLQVEISTSLTERSALQDVAMQFEVAPN